MKIELKGIFDKLIIDNVTNITNVPNNAKTTLNLLDNCRVVTNNKFIFFKGYGEDAKTYKTEYNYNLEVQIKGLI